MSTIPNIVNTSSDQGPPDVSEKDVLSEIRYRALCEASELMDVLQGESEMTSVLTILQSVQAAMDIFQRASVELFSRGATEHRG